MAYKAWIIAPARGRGTKADRERIRRLLDGLGEEWRPAAVDWVRGEDGPQVTNTAVEKAVEAIAAHDGQRLVWIAADTQLRMLGRRFLQTDSGTATIPLPSLWEVLNEAAGRSSSPLIAIVDVCHAAVPEHLVNSLHSNLVAVCASKARERAFADDGGGWLTRQVCDFLAGKHGGPLTVGRLSVFLAEIRDAMGHGMQRAKVWPGDHDTLVLNVLRQQGPPPPPVDLIPAYRAQMRAEHAHVVPFFGGTALLDEVYVELDLACERDEMGGSAAPRSFPGGKLTLEALLKRDDGPWVVLGEPGAGKSTIARHLCWALCDPARDDALALPVYVSLPRLADETTKHPFELVEDDLTGSLGDAARGFAQHLHARARQPGRLWLMLDGLDEVPGTRQEAVRRKLVGLRAALPHARIVVLSRPHGYRPLAGFRAARVQTLPPEQQQRLLDKWLPGRGAEAWRDVCAQPALRSMAGYPLLLTLMALVYRENGQLPPSLMTLYDRAIDLLLTRGFHPVPKGMQAPAATRRVLNHLSLALQCDVHEHWTPAQLESALRGLERRQPRVPRKHRRGDGGATPAALLKALHRFDAPSTDLADDREQETKDGREAFLQRVADRSGIIGAHNGESKPWKYLHRALRDALTAELLADAEPEPLQQWVESVAAADLGRWGEVVGHVGARRRAAGIEDDEAWTKLLESLPERAAQLLLEGDEPPSADDATFFAARAESLPEEVAQMARRWPDTLREALWSRVTPDADTETLAVLHYALSAAGTVDDARFFSQAGRDNPRPELPWVDLDGGSFEMGSPLGEGYDDERPQHTVTLSPFSMTPTTVTRVHYRAFDPQHECPGEDDHPVTEVSSYAARLFARWLSVGQAPAHTVGLPTEAQWEYACRAGTTTPWSCGDEASLEKVAWYDENASGPQPVRTRDPNPWGLYDLHGNVWEWCQDWFGPYTADAAVDPFGPSDGRWRVRRGGAYWSDADGCRSAYRVLPPGNRGLDHGFRLVRPAPDARS